MYVADSSSRYGRGARILAHSHRAYRNVSTGQSASAKLFADAETEEREETERRSKPSQADIIMNKHENWDGEERVQDTVLRMLVDKYKPLRTGQIQTADEKIKASLPQVSKKSVSDARTGWISLESTITYGGSFAEPNGTLSPEPTKGDPQGDPLPPWLVTFKVPSHAQASIKLGNFTSTPPRPVTFANSSYSGDPHSARSRAERKAEKRFSEGAGRVDRARDMTLDYRIGVRGQDGGGGGRTRPNPVSMRGWNNLIEERIQQAKAMGAFDKLEGRGKPFRHTVDEINPFVAREEFLMNRIVRKNDAAPPWVELQKDADRTIQQMRELLLSGWIRRALRMLPLNNSTSTLQNMTAEEATGLRDIEWERQEEKFHDATIREANAAIRRYNTVAPYVVRRPSLMRQAELERCYASAGSMIIEGLRERLTAGHHARSEESPQSEPAPDIGWGLGLVLRNAVRRVYARFSNVVVRRMY